MPYHIPECLLDLLSTCFNEWVSLQIEMWKGILSFAMTHTRMFIIIVFGLPLVWLGIITYINLYRPLNEAKKKYPTITNIWEMLGMPFGLFLGILVILIISAFLKYNSNNSNNSNVHETLNSILYWIMAWGTVVAWSYQRKFNEEQGKITKYYYEKEQEKERMQKVVDKAISGLYMIHDVCLMFANSLNPKKVDNLKDLNNHFESRIKYFLQNANQDSKKNIVESVVHIINSFTERAYLTWKDKETYGLKYRLVIFNRDFLSDEKIRQLRDFLFNFYDSFQNENSAYELLKGHEEELPDWFKTKDYKDHEKYILLRI